jgi:outer membrane murein-binding lipoprotein Lpp
MTARTRSHVVAMGTVLAGLILAGCANPQALDQTTTPEDSLARV